MFLQKIILFNIFVFTSLAAEFSPTINNFKFGDIFEVKRNDYKLNEISERKNPTDNYFSDYIRSHNLIFKFPITGSSVLIDARKFDQDEINLKLNLNEGKFEARKSKLKKIVGPILVFVFLKALVLIPLALGILGIKTWNALQLSFVSFVISIGMAVYQMCKKVAGDHVVPPIITSSNTWEPSPYAERSISQDASSYIYFR